MSRKRKGKREYLDGGQTRQLMRQLNACMHAIVTGATLAVLLISILTLLFNIQQSKAEPKTWTVDDDGPADFHTIQEAINACMSSKDQVSSFRVILPSQILL